MNFTSLIADHSLYSIFALLLFAFLAGFIDSIVGGGGLIQLPALLINLPNTPLPVLFGTNKIAGLSGTTVAAYQYSKRIKFNFKLLITISFFSFIASFLGAKTVSHLDGDSLRPVILIILIVMAIYTFIKKDLGAIQSKELSLQKQLIFGSIMGVLVGFYDGFFGPGAGSFLVLGFVVLLGFEFVVASAYAKFINCVTNISALMVFVRQGSYIIELALLMAICNVIGSIIGSRVALKRGNGFIRVIFLVVVFALIIRYGYDIFFRD